jgi:hypothetical protein
VALTPGAHVVGHYWRQRSTLPFDVDIVVTHHHIFVHFVVVQSCQWRCSLFGAFVDFLGRGGEGVIAPMRNLYRIWSKLAKENRFRGLLQKWTVCTTCSRSKGLIAHTRGQRSNVIPYMMIDGVRKVWHCTSTLMVPSINQKMELTIKQMQRRCFNTMEK